MKLSEAIRAGSKIRPQAHGGMYAERRTQPKRRWWQIFRKPHEIVERLSCAMGAAIEAADCPITKGPKTEISTPLRGEDQPAGSEVETIVQPQEWNIVLLRPFDCPQCGVRELGFRLIPHLNDDHRWTREQIALWVERIENAGQQQEPMPPVRVESVQSEEWPDEISA